MSNSEWARYLYYLGRIKAIQLDYSEAHKHLLQSIRKAPSSALGFRHTVHKLSITVQLLLGNIPERQLFLQPANKEALAPYFELTKGMKKKIRLLFTPFKEISSAEVMQCQPTDVRLVKVPPFLLTMKFFFAT